MWQSALFNERVFFPNQLNALVALYPTLGKKSLHSACA